MSNYGVKISQPGFNVLTTAKENLVFSSGYDTFKVFMSGSGNRTISAADDFWTPRQSIVTITHSLGYVPMFFCFVNNPIWSASGDYSPYCWKPIGSAHNLPSYSVGTTYLDLYFWNSDDTQSHTFEYRYFIFYNDFT